MILETVFFKLNWRPVASVIADNSIGMVVYNRSLIDKLKIQRVSYLVSSWPNLNLDVLRKN